MEFTRLYFVKFLPLVLYSKATQSKQSQYLSYIKFNIISQILLHVTFFYTKHLTPYNVCVYLNSPPPRTTLLPHVVFLNKTIIIIPRFCVQSEPMALCSWSTVALQYDDSGEVPNIGSIRWLHDTSHKFPTLKSPYYQPGVSCTFSFTHSNPNPTNGSWTVNFPSHCSSDTHHCTHCVLFQGL
jgi:hypothetical protein